ncbi:flagellin [Hellea sp.]|nr:flagellin [Hellea sp.]
MSSIITNNSAMVALDTLRGINSNLEMVQSEISTGKKVNSAKDNAAIWAISTVMSTDVESFDQISDSLNLGSATVGVARAASEQVTDLLQDMKSLIVSAQEENVDRDKIQTDISELTAQIGSVVGAAQFNGANLLNEAGSINVLSSLDRAADGTVTASQINVQKENLTTDAAVLGTDTLTAGNGGAATIAASGADVDEGASTTVTIAAGANGVVEGTTTSFDVNGETISYISTAGDTNEDVASGLVAAAAALNDGEGVEGFTFSAAAGVLTVNNVSGGDDAVVDNATVFEGGKQAGALAGLETIDVTSTEGAAAALSNIEGFLQSAIDAAANFGSKQTRIENQVEFVSTLSDALTTGIGALTDSDLEEASARLQSLQVQQQLGVQALSIANSGPQQLLSLFR